MRHGRQNRGRERHGIRSQHQLHHAVGHVQRRDAPGRHPRGSRKNRVHEKIDLKHAHAEKYRRHQLPNFAHSRIAERHVRAKPHPAFPERGDEDCQLQRRACEYPDGQGHSRCAVSLRRPAQNRPVHGPDRKQNKYQVENRRGRCRQSEHVKTVQNRRAQRRQSQKKHAGKDYPVQKNRQVPVDAAQTQQREYPDDLFRKYAPQGGDGSQNHRHVPKHPLREGPSLAARFPSQVPHEHRNKRRPQSAFAGHPPYHVGDTEG